MKNPKVIISIAIAACWLAYSHAFGAFATATAEANKSGRGGAFSFGGRKSIGYLGHCQAKKNRVILAAVQKQRQQVNQKYRQRQGGALTLSFLGALFNQSFGDKNYENYKKKYGTNPFNALSGGTLEKAPGALGKFAASSKNEAMKKLDTVQRRLVAQARLQCQCQFSQAFHDTHGSWTIASATFGFVRSSDTQNPSFFSIADGKARTCS